MVGMMEYQYRRMAYELVTEQRDEIMNEANETIAQTTIPFGHFIKKAASSITAFLHSLH
jgi:hypothetical protein